MHDSEQGFGEKYQLKYLIGLFWNLFEDVFLTRNAFLEIHTMAKLIGFWIFQKMIIDIESSLCQIHIFGG
jgi:hypothetical protein